MTSFKYILLHPWILHIAFNLYSSLPNPHRFNFHSIPTNFVSLFFNQPSLVHTSWFVMFHLILDILLRKTNPPISGSFQSLVALHLVVGHHDQCHQTHTWYQFVWLGLPHALCLLSRLFEFMYAVTHSVWKELIPCIYPWLLAFKTIWPWFCSNPESRNVKMCKKKVTLSTENSAVPYSLHL